MGGDVFYILGFFLEGGDYFYWLQYFNWIMFMVKGVVIKVYSGITKMNSGNMEHQLSKILCNLSLT